MNTTIAGVYYFPNLFSFRMKDEYECKIVLDKNVNELPPFIHFLHKKCKKENEPSSFMLKKAFK